MWYGSVRDLKHNELSMFVRWEVPTKFFLEYRQTLELYVHRKL